MKHFLKVTDWKRVSGSDREMMYQDNNGEWFVGSAHDVVIGKTYTVELSHGTLEDGHRHIVKFIR